MNARRREIGVATGLASLAVIMIVSRVPFADDPVAATGIGLQTLAGLLAAVPLWANAVSDAVLRWLERQIATPRRFLIMGLLNGSAAFRFDRRRLSLDCVRCVPGID